MMLSLSFVMRSAHRKGAENRLVLFCNEHLEELNKRYSMGGGASKTSNKNNEGNGSEGKDTTSALEVSGEHPPEVIAVFESRKKRLDKVLYGIII